VTFDRQEIVVNPFLSRRRRALNLAAVTAMAIGCVAVFISFGGDPPLAVAVLLALLPPALCIVFIVGELRRVHASEGVERLLYTESSALAFWVVIATALIYLWLEPVLHAPRLSMAFVVLYGLLARALLTKIGSRRLLR